jgi:DNA excision repair protein ERCC-3
MPPGFGKTRTALELVRVVGGKALAVVPTRAIAAQWRDEAARLGLADTVTVLVINTARAKPEAFFAGFRTAVLDEAHELCAAAASEVLWATAARTPFVLGLSATPFARPDGLDHFITFFLGQPIKVGAAADHFQGEVQEVSYTTPPAFAEPVFSEGGSVQAVGTIARLLSDPARMQLVADEALALWDAGHNVYVFAELREYLSRLGEHLAAQRGIAFERTDEMFYILRGGVAAATVDAARAARGALVLTTYGFSRRGVDLPAMTAMVLASPRRNGMEQIAGRIFRRGGAAGKRVIVDVVDQGSALASQAASRRATFRELGLAIPRRAA